MTEQEVIDQAKALMPWHYCFDLYGFRTGTTKPDYYEKLDIMIQAGAFSRPVYNQVLDLGANSGIVSLYFANHKHSKVLAVEGGPIFHKQLELICKHKEGGQHITPKFADLRHFTGYDDKGYDCVLLLGVLHHIPVEDRQYVIDVCYKAANHLAEVYIQTKADIGVEGYLERAGFKFIEPLCDWPGQNRQAWVCRKDPMKV